MKKWLAGLGILGLSVLTLAACGNKSDNKASGEKQTITVATDSIRRLSLSKKVTTSRGMILIWSRLFSRTLISMRSSL